MSMQLVADLHESIVIMRNHKQYIPAVMDVPLNYARAIAEELYDGDPFYDVQPTDEVSISLDGKPFITLRAL